MAELGEYHERRFDGKRDFKLLGDRIEIEGSASLGSSFELKIPLNTLSPEIDRLWSRPPGFWSGVIMALIFLAGPQCFLNAMSTSAIGLLSVFGIGGLLLALATRKRVEWVVFKNLAGTTGIDIAKVGPDTSQFEEFALSVSNAIRLNKERTDEKNGT